MKRWREIYKQLTPAWMHRSGDGGEVLFSLMTLLDAFAERARLGLEARHPTRASDDEALSLIGFGRGITRGRDEASEHYAQRLIGWRYPRGHRVRGSALDLLEQVSEYFGGWPCYVIDARGNKRSYDGAGGYSYSYNNTWNWDGDPQPELRWSRFWIVLLPPAGAVLPQLDWGDPDLWGGELFLEGYAIGHRGITYRDAKAIKGMMTGSGTARRPGGTMPQYVIVSLDGSDPVPDGTWTDWSEYDSDTLPPYAGADTYTDPVPLIGGGTYAGDGSGWAVDVPLVWGELYPGTSVWRDLVTRASVGVQVPKPRSAHHRFLGLVPKVQHYAGRVVFPVSYQRPDLTIYEGTPDWRDVVELLGGETYAGSDQWRGLVPRTDDGGIPV